MSSIIGGYNYDIFISYRQNDNKYDGWVTEFVTNLNKELEATIKEKITVYFDENPHDGLLETHSVNHSLEDKLKCVIIIPILSKTYCDSNCFAWNNEFLAFLKITEADRFGLNVKLKNSNVASRVLPVRIHDLAPDDVELVGKYLGFIRSVDFIYKSPGVNRPLRANEDHPQDNLNKTYYRDQINKVANAIEEIIHGLKMLQTVPLDEKGLIEEPVDEVSKEHMRIATERKEVKNKSGGFRKGGEEYIQKVPGKKKRWMVTVIGVIILCIIPGILLVNHKLKVKWALTRVLPEIQNLLDEENEENVIKAFDLTQKIGKYVSGNSDFRKAASYVTGKLTILTDPPDAEVFIRKYAGDEGEWEKIGRTPIDTLKLPNWTFYQVKLVKTGYDNVFAIASTTIDTLYRKLFRESTIPPGMVYVEGTTKEVRNIYFNDKTGFFIDRYEITNKQYKKFVDKGGYINPAYWENEFIKDGKTLSFDEAMAEFKDKTGITGPATWEAGDYPDGQDDYPVSGISWYEAAAYAEFSGKDLPTALHWHIGAGLFYDKDWSGGNSFMKIISFSNFTGKSPEPVGKFPGINHFGVYDMAGNIREWCWNKSRTGRIIRGGSWDDAFYMYPNVSQLPPFDRSPKNGIRCIQYIDKGKIPEQIFGEISVSTLRDYSKEKPVSDELFRVYKNQFLYDKTDLNARIEERDETPDNWIIENISFNAAYGNERINAILYLPKNARPPFQTIIYFPGSYPIFEKDIKKDEGRIWMNDYLLKNGRAVFCPGYRGTYERNNGLTMEMSDPNLSHQFTEWLIAWVKDFSRSLDYLETRSDIDTSKLGFYGWSWGGEIGAYIPAVEDRLKISILIVGGFWGKAFDEADQVNYVSRIKIPVLMLNGKYDMLMTYEIKVKPFYDLLGTQEKDKRLCLFETDHNIPKSDMVREVINWLDKYFGHIKR